MFNVSVNDKKNIYRSKPVMNVDTVPKPLTYDYMPEGYPSKDIEYVTLMEEQEVAFSEQDGLMGAISPVVLAIKQGDKVTIVWDGVSYDAVVKIAGPVPGVAYLLFGNLGLVGEGGATDYPFLYVDQGNGVNLWYAADTATSHTIGVMRQRIKYTPIDANYMPEGYPSKSVGTVMLIEEREVTFSKSGSNMRARTPTLDIKLGDKLTIIWDGVSYNAIVKRVNDGHSEVLAFGNLGLVNLGDAEDYPFVCGMSGSSMVWTTADTATSHTIGVMRQRETYTPIDINYMPKNLNVVFIVETGNIPTSCNVTYDELRGWVENNIPILSIYRRIDSNYTEIITTIRLNSGSLVLKTAINNGFTYNSDGTFSVVEEV